MLEAPEWSGWIEPLTTVHRNSNHNTSSPGRARWSPSLIFEIGTGATLARNAVPTNIATCRPEGPHSPAAGRVGIGRLVGQAVLSCRLLLDGSFDWSATEGART